MNRTSSGSMRLEKAIQGFIQSKQAEGCSDNTIVTYTQQLGVWREHAGDVDVNAVTSQDVRAFLAWLRQEYQPHRITGHTQPLSAKTIRNYWVSLSAFFTWASTEFHFDNPMTGVPAPKFADAPVEPFTREEIEQLLKAAEFCNRATTTRRRCFVMRRPTARRDRALILVLLDTGLRASEVCALNVGDVDLKSGQVRVKHGEPGGATLWPPAPYGRGQGQGGKGRVVFLGQSARRSLWRYLATCQDGQDADAPLFLGKLHRRMNKNVLRQLIARLGQKAGVAHAHPHRFRHTFTLTYLRSGGDVFTLQALLGHSTLEMVQHYARLAQVDIEHAHRRASPVDNWHL